MNNQIFLNQTITCKECAGTGSAKKEKEEDEEKICPICVGAGAVIDNVIPDIIKKHNPELKRSIIPKIMEEIFNHIEDKLKDSYERGTRDAKKPTEKKTMEKAPRNKMISTTPKTKGAKKTKGGKKRKLPKKLQKKSVK